MIRKAEILITVGVSEALKCVFSAICNEGDEIIVPQPCFVAYEPEIIFAGGVPVAVVTTAENNFEVTAEQIEAKITDRTKAIFFGYPNNPTGAVLSRENAVKISELAEKHNLLVISDEIYDRLTYGRRTRLFFRFAKSQKPHDFARRIFKRLRDDRLARRLYLRRTGIARSLFKNSPILRNERTDDFAIRRARCITNRRIFCFGNENRI